MHAGTDMKGYVKALISMFLVDFLPNNEAVVFPYPRIKLEAKYSKDAGEPLILTPYLRNNSIDIAQSLSRVPLTENLGLTSYSGYFTVNEKYDSNLFFWYFPPVYKVPSSPVILWLQGGPGGSSLFGLFMEIGPLKLTKKGFTTRKYHWALNYHVIFIDNPVGTGFSFTKHTRGYCSNEECVGKDLYTALQQFFTLFPSIRANDFYITGESYAGKYIPALGMQIHNQNLINKNKINLKGMAMGNAYCDPIHQMDYGKYLYQHGLLDSNQRDIFEKMQNEIISKIHMEQWIVADILMDRLLDGEFGNYSYFKKFTGFEYFYNFLNTKNDMDVSMFTDLLKNDTARSGIHVGSLPFNSGTEVQFFLLFDLLKSVAAYVSELLNHYRVMFYNGQLDIIVPYPLTEKFLQNLKFKSADEYKIAKRYIWRVDDDIAGYIKKAGNLTEVLVRNAGHLVPQDQPKWALDLISRFIKGSL